MPRGVWGGGVPAAPQGDLNLLLSFYTFLKGLYSFYLRKRDQPVGKWGRRGGRRGVGMGGEAAQGGTVMTQQLQSATGGTKTEHANT